MKRLLIVFLSLFSFHTFAAQDYGVDVGIVTVQKTQLRSEPLKDSKSVASLKQSNIVVILDREENDDWLNVLDVGTAKEGWVLKKFLKIQYTQNPSQGANFQAESIPSLITPEVAIENASYKDLNLKVGSEIHQIQAHSHKTISIEPGMYKYYASAPGVIPAIGARAFDTGTRYTWKFWIETSYSRAGGRRTRR